MLANKVEEYFHDNYIPVTESGCWLWLRGCNSDGYACMTVGITSTRVHKWAYEKYKHIVPTKMTLDHLCRVRSCVNPDHLDCISNWENSFRGDTLTGINARKTHCKNGHEFTAQNTEVYKTKNRKWSNGIIRRCKICRRIYNKQWKTNFKKGKIA